MSRLRIICIHLLISPFHHHNPLLWKFVMNIDPQPRISTAQYTILQLGHIVPPTPAELFDYFVSVFRVKGINFPAQDVDRLHRLVPDSPELISVIPPKPNPLDLDGLMALIELDGHRGENFLNSASLNDIVATPSEAHLLLNVYDGHERLNTRSSISFQKIAQEKRLAYTVWYGLIHTIAFPFVLYHHNLDLVGSSYCSRGNPRLSLYHETKTPSLDFSYGDAPSPFRGAPSAGSFLVLDPTS